MWLIENCRNLKWLSNKLKIPYSTLRYKVSNKTNMELIHSLSYFEYVKIENIMNGETNG